MSQIASTPRAARSRLSYRRSAQPTGTQQLRLAKEIGWDNPPEVGAAWALALGAPRRSVDQPSLGAHVPSHKVHSSFGIIS